MSQRARKGEFVSAIRAERLALADVVEGMTPSQWGMVSGSREWTVGEVVSHLVATDRFPWGAALSPLRFRSPRRALADWQRRHAARGPAAAAAELRSGRVTIFARWFGRFGAVLAYIEQLAHGEDAVRPAGLARAAPPDETLVWEAIRFVGPRQTRKLGARGLARLQDGAGQGMTFELRRGRPRLTDGDPPDALIAGRPLELLLFLTGRPADVEITGRGELADAARTASLTY